MALGKAGGLAADPPATLIYSRLAIDPHLLSAGGE